MGRQLRARQAPAARVLCSVLLPLLAWLAAAGASAQLQLGPWANLSTSSDVVWDWELSLAPLASTNLTVPWGSSEPLTLQVRATTQRFVASAGFAFSGTLPIANRGPWPVRIGSVAVRCDWGGDISLPCAWSTASSSSSSSSSARRLAAVQPQHAKPTLEPGQALLCSVADVPVRAEWDTADFSQPCVAVVTTSSGQAAESAGGFPLDFAAPHQLSQANECLQLDGACSVTQRGSYALSVTGLPSGLRLCGSQAAAGPGGEAEPLDLNLAVTGNFTAAGAAQGACDNAAEVTCRLQATMQTGSAANGSRPLQQGRVLAQSLKLSIAPHGCPGANAATPPPAPPLPAPPRRLFWRLEPRLAISVDRTYLVGSWLWQLSSSVAPGSLDVFAGSSAAAQVAGLAQRPPASATVCTPLAPWPCPGPSASRRLLTLHCRCPAPRQLLPRLQYTVAATRLPASSGVPLQHLVDGTVGIGNPHRKALFIQALSVLLPWGHAANVVCPDLVLPGPLAPKAQHNCSFRFAHELGLAPSHVAAQALLAGGARPRPVLSRRNASFDFTSPDYSLSVGACAQLVTAFQADHTQITLTHIGGAAPAFSGRPEPASLICDDTRFDFTVLAAPTAGVTAAEVPIETATVLQPVSGTAAPVHSTRTSLVARVREWPAAWSLEALPRRASSTHARAAGVQIPTMPLAAAAPGQELLPAYSLAGGAWDGPGMGVYPVAAFTAAQMSQPQVALQG